MRATYTALLYKLASFIRGRRGELHALACCFLLSILASCSDKKCIDADDFGFPTAVVLAGFEAKDLEGPEVFQVAPWTDSGYTLNGDPVTIMVKNWISGLDYNNDGEVSAWCPWYAEGAPPGMLSDLCERLQECIFLDGKMIADSPDLPALGAPCTLTKGKGMYALLAKYGYNPNKSEDSKKLPKGINFHLGEDTSVSESSDVGYTMYDIDRLGNSRRAGGVVYHYKDEETARKYTGGTLFFKILDKYYEDNSGQYRVLIKSGVDLGSGDPITFITNKVKEQLYGSPDRVSYGIVEGLYRKIVGTAEFKNIVRGMITLYVIVSALSFLAGTMKATHTEFIGRLIKFAVVSVLLTSDQSWTFFKDYLFVYFIDGVQFVMYSIQKAGAGGPGSINILGIMMAHETFTKLFSLLFADYLGFVYIILYLILLFFMVKVVFFATVVYLVALVTISMILILGPFFICMLLFDFTRPFFDNWLKELIKYSLIPIILFSGISFMGSIIRHEIYASLGFKVCKRDLFTMPNLKLFTESEGKYEVVNSLIYWWYPSKFMDDRNSLSATERIGRAVSGEGYQSVSEPSIEAMIPVPEAYMEDDGTLCKAYECFKKRNIDFPFLDLEKDSARLEAFKSNHFVDLESILVIFIMVILLDKFNKSAEMIAQMLANATSSRVSVTNAARGASNALLGAGFSAAKSAAGAGLGAASKARNAARNLAGRFSRSGPGTGMSQDHMSSRPAAAKRSLGDATLASKKKTPPPVPPRRKSKTPPPVPPRRAKPAPSSTSTPTSTPISNKQAKAKAREEKHKESKRMVKEYMKKHPGVSQKAARRAVHRERMRRKRAEEQQTTTTSPPVSTAPKGKPAPAKRTKPASKRTATSKHSKRSRRGKRKGRTRRRRR